MTDLFANAREMLSDVAIRKAELSSELARLDRLEAALREALGGGSNSSVDMSSASLQDFLLNTIPPGDTMQHNELRDKAIKAGFLQDSQSPGRSVQAALMSLAKYGKLRSLGNGLWKKPDEKEAPPKGGAS